MPYDKTGSPDLEKGTVDYEIYLRNMVTIRIFEDSVSLCHIFARGNEHETEAPSESVERARAARHAFMAPHLKPGKRGISRIATEAQIQQSSLSKWHRGLQTLHPDNVRKLAMTLDVPPEDIPNSR
jgi:hypothetical protein